MTNGVRKINGKNYHLYDGFRTKKQAKSQAKGLRKDGAKVRVVKSKGELPHLLYVHHPKSGYR
jgi:hypothetical protein